MNNLKNSISTIWKKNESEILTGFGIGGLVFATVWGITITFKVSKIIQKLKEENPEKAPTKKDIFKKVWIYYLPVILSSGLSISSIILGNRASAKKNAALIAAYAMAETAYNEYREQTLKTVGEIKEQSIREKITEKKVSDSRSTNNILLTGDGDCLFYEPISGRYFRSNWNKILKAANEINARAISDLDGTTSLTDWFDEIGLQKTDISDILGWNVVNGPNDGIINISVVATLTPDNVPCGSIDYKALPKPI